jgi:two-component system sensor histidine kinase MprB
MLPLDEQSQKFIKNIINATDRIMDMISQLLDIAQMNENPEQYRVKFDMSEAVQRAITDVEGNALDRRMEIVFEVIGSPYVVLGDERRLYRCALNLLDNALKYAPPDSQIFVTLSYSDKGLTMTVRDQGDGISEADIPHVFERFFRSKQHTTRLGIGLGLEFVAATARAHGGDIKVENHPEGGAVFIFTLPPGVRTASPTPTSA